MVKIARWGTYLPETKEKTSGRLIEDASLPSEVVISLCQHIGAPCDPLVEKGDRVLIGQKIGDTEAFCSAPIHASVSGEVIGVEPRPHFTGDCLLSVVIAPDGKQESVEFAGVSGKLTPKKVRCAVREAGLVGLGGAAFPTHVKLCPPEGKSIDSVIINGCECEPFITCDHRNMLEKTDLLLDGLRIIMATVEAEKGYIGIEMNKLDAIRKVEELVAGEENVKVACLDTKYPHGAEKQLIKAILEREVPSGGLPMDVGALVHNAGTTIAISEAVREGKPLTERVLTVTGPGVKNPKNLRVRIGTPIGHLIEECGGFEGEPGKVIMGGPMTGFAQFSVDVPVVKGTSGVILFPRDQVKITPHDPCFRCGRCIRACPVFLIPNFIGLYVERDMIDKAEAYSVMDCIECGLCGYVCPARRPTVQYMKYAKGKIMARRKKTS